MKNEGAENSAGLLFGDDGGADDSSAAVPPIMGFNGEFEFLSNFVPCRIDYEGIVYPTVEHAFQSAKTFDTIERHRIAALPKPGQAKRAGRRVLLRSDWETVKFSIMEELLRIKFANDDLKRKLLATAPREIYEVNTWNDRIWGVVRGKTGAVSGKNHLGVLLAKVRDSLA